MSWLKDLLGLPKQDNVMLKEKTMGRLGAAPEWYVTKVKPKPFIAPAPVSVPMNREQITIDSLFGETKEPLTEAELEIAYMDRYTEPGLRSKYTPRFAPSNVAMTPSPVGLTPNGGVFGDNIAYGDRQSVKKSPWSNTDISRMVGEYNAYKRLNRIREAEAKAMANSQFSPDIYRGIRGNSTSE